MKRFRVVAVFHGEKTEGLKSNLPLEVRVNPPMTPEGMSKIFALGQRFEKYGPFDVMYCSRLARALDTASVLALKFSMDFQTIAKLGQHANKDESGVIYYPGHESESFVDWQSDGLDALGEISDCLLRGFNTVLIVSHRPVIAGFIAASRGSIGDEGVLSEIVNNPKLATNGFVVFDFDTSGNKLTLVE